MLKETEYQTFKKSWTLKNEWISEWNTGTSLSFPLFDRNGKNELIVWSLMRKMPFTFFIGKKAKWKNFLHISADVYLLSGARVRFKEMRQLTREEMKENRAKPLCALFWLLYDNTGTFKEFLNSIKLMSRQFANVWSKINDLRRKKVCERNWN